MSEVRKSQGILYKVWSVSTLHSHPGTSRRNLWSQESELVGMKSVVVTDPIADMLVRINNASKAKHTYAEMPSSKMKVQIAEILKREGFIEDCQLIESSPFNVLRVKLRYTKDKQQVIKGIRKISKPGLRVYVKKDEVPRVLGGLGIAIVSTSKGLLTDREARAQSLGGEVICYVW